MQPEGLLRGQGLIVQTYTNSPLSPEARIGHLGAIKAETGLGDGTPPHFTDDSWYDGLRDSRDGPVQCVEGAGSQGFGLLATDAQSDSFDNKKSPPHSWLRKPLDDTRGINSFSPARKNSPRLTNNEDAVTGPADTVGIYVPSARRGFESIADAVLNAVEGDVITLQEGIYLEEKQLVLTKKGLSIVAAEPGKVTIVFTGSHKTMPVLLKGQNVRLSGLILHRLESKEKPEGQEAVTNNSSGACVVVDSGDARIEDCTIKCQTGTAIFVLGSSTPTISNCSLTENFNAAIVCGGTTFATVTGCTIKRNMGFGVWLLDRADGLFSRNKIGRNSKCGVLCCGKAKGTFDHNKVSSGGQGGFWMQGESSTTVTNNVITKNHRAAMQVGDSADPIVAHNMILEGEGGGVVVHDKARGLFFRNNLSGSCRAGAGVMDNASPLFLANIMSKNNGGGAVVAGDSSPSFIGNEFVSNGFVGVGMKENSSVLMQGNNVVGTEGYGILMQGNSKIHLQDCRIEKNEQSGVCACDSAHLTAYGCTILAGDEKPIQQCGVTLHGQSTMEMRDTTISGHSSGNILLNDHSSGSLSHSIVSNSRNSGVTLQGSASLRLYRNVISGNRVSNVLVLDNTSLTAEWNTISEGSGCGIRAMGTPTCEFRHNTIMSNGESGIVCSGKMSVDMQLNRVSQNGKIGICIEGVDDAIVVDNAVFENVATAVRLKNVLNCKVTGNLLVGALDKNSATSTAFVLRGTVGGHLADNVMQSKQGSVIAGDALPQILEANILCQTMTQTRNAIAAALDSLQLYEKRRDELSLVYMPDGSTCVAMRCSVKVKQQQHASSLPNSPAAALVAADSPKASKLRKNSLLGTIVAQSFQNSPRRPGVGSPSVGSPRVGSQSVGSPRVVSQNVGSSSVSSPNVGSPRVGSQSVGSPRVASQNVGSPSVGSPSIGNPSLASAEGATQSPRGVMHL